MADDFRITWLLVARSPETWGGEYLAYANLSDAFLASLVNANAFDAALPFMRAVPLKTKVPTSAVAATGYTVVEGEVKALSDLALSNQALEPTRVAALIAVTNDLLKLGGSVRQRCSMPSFATASPWRPMLRSFQV
jgi:hypothetical protein